jgi:DNA-binding response OmpR family regulator
MMGSAEVPNEDRAQRALLATIRHELRTPINAIIGYSEMLLEDAEEVGAGDGIAADLRKIHTAGGQLLSTVNDILDPEKIEAGGVDLEACGATLRHELRTPVTAIIGYSEMLLEDAESDGWEAAAPDLEKIHAASERFLTMIDDIVMFGASEGDAILPVGEGHAATTLAAETLRSIPAVGVALIGHTLHPRHPILVVDDNAINREMLARRLERQGYSVAVAENGRQALEMARAEPYDLMLLDMMMPEMNGFQVLQIWMADPVLSDVPVIVVSALDEIESVARCVELGATDYLAKPFNPVLLRARVEACLEKKWLRDQEVEYLHDVSLLTAAAVALEASNFDPQSLTSVAAREDRLGHLARVFQRMAREVATREERLKQQVIDLRIEIDHAKKARSVAEIADTEYFRHLQQRAARLRARPQ